MSDFGSEDLGSIPSRASKKLIRSITVIIPDSGSGDLSSILSGSSKT